MNLRCALIVPVLGLGVAVSNSMAQGLGAGSFRAVVSTPGGGVDTDFLPVPTSAAFSYSASDNQGNSVSYTGRATAGGGSIPTADIDASGTGSFGSNTGPTTTAQVFYGYRIMARGGSTRTSVPIIVTVQGEAHVVPTDQFSDASANSQSIVRRPGSSTILAGGAALATVNSNTMTPDSHYATTQSSVVGVGSIGQVELYANGSIRLNAEINAVADPIIVIDPDATYEENGQTYFYKDEFEIEYSETIVQWVPCPADFTGDGVLDFFDVSGFLGAFNASDAHADFNGDGIYDFFDVSLFLQDFNAGCP